MADALLTIDNVVKRFDDATILDGISFSVKKSQIREEQKKCPNSRRFIMNIITESTLFSIKSAATVKYARI